MKEYKVKDLVKLITESKLDEDMAYVPGGERTKKITKAKPEWIAKPDPKDPNPENPDAWILNPTMQEGKEIALIYTHGQEVDSWLSNPSNKEWLDKVISPKVQQKGENLKIVDWKKTKYFNPKSSDIKKLSTVGIDWPKPDGDKMDVREIILRNMLYPFLTEFTQYTNDELIRNGVPPITLPKQIYGEQTENIDKYMVINNDRIKWRTYTSYYFDSYQDYQDYLTGDSDVEPVISHQPRRYNPGSNWSPLRKTEKRPSYIPNDKSKYNINRSGYSDKPYGVIIGSELIVEGERVVKEGGGEMFNWKLTFVVESGKKGENEKQVEKIDTDISLESTSTTGLVQSVLNGKDNISSSELVRKTFSKALSDLTSKIGSNVTSDIFSDLSEKI